MNLARMRTCGGGEERVKRRLAVPCCSVAPAPPREKARERKNTALRPLLLVPSARLATSVERKGEARQGAGGRNGMRNGRERKRRQGRERPGRDGGRPLVGGLRSFGLLHCGIRSRRHCGARMAAPGTAIVENERDGQHWGRHLPHGVTVAQLLGSNLESGDRARE